MYKNEKYVHFIIKLHYEGVNNMNSKLIELKIKFLLLAASTLLVSQYLS